MRTSLALLLLAALNFLGFEVRAGDFSHQNETCFYQSLGHGDAAALREQMHPALRELVDQPVVEAWATAARENLGAHLSTRRIDFVRKQRLAGVETEIVSVVEFERGTAEASLKFLDDRLVAFDVQSDQMRNWFQGPSRIDLYTDRAQAFIVAFLKQDASATRSMMHKALQQVLAEGELELMMQSVAENGGKLQSATLRTHNMLIEKERQVLQLTFDLECEKASGECEIEFQFVGMQGHLTSFNFR